MYGGSQVASPPCVWSSRTHLRRWLIAGCVLALVGGAAAYLRWRPTHVTVEPVRRGRAVEAVYATGTVEPIHKVIVKARIGEHVAGIDVLEGDRVAKDQVLARLDSTVRDLALSQGKTQLDKARTLAGPKSPQLAGLESQIVALRSQLELANIELDRTERLFAAKAVTKQELDVARARVVQLDAQTQVAAEQRRTARVELDATAAQLASQVSSLASEADESTVRSPIAGVVLRSDVEPGEAVAPNQALFEIADTRTLLVELKVDEADIARIADGPDASTVALAFYAFPGRAFAGKVTTILPDPDRERRSYTVKVSLDEPIEGLRVGMTAEANIVLSRKDDVLLIPAEAVQGELAWFVEDGRAVRRNVTLGIRTLTHVELVDGAAEGARAIVDTDGKSLSPGTRVTTTVRRAP